MTQLACKRGQSVGWLPNSGNEDAWIEAAIATAIREARNAALEEAAELALNYMGGGDISARILALKDKP